ncbi:S8 family serine peptidase [Nocardioides dongkuii]|uniref:S8 family serine peptidase n=1 Tax=Nocardioides dongkuii TaxID=2760089 RepID=UPI0015FD9C8F|nr:S8 family serine peptidase [Nocardioides dongkuii]
MPIRPFRSVAIAGVSLALAAASLAVAPSPATASPSGKAPAVSEPERPAAKLTAGVRRELAGGTRADYWVRFDGSGLTGLAAADSWEERGHAVHDALRAAARSSQRDVRAELDARGVDYTAYWISDAILVHRGTLSLATTLARESEVVQIRPTTSWEQEPPVAESGSRADDGVVPWGIQAVHADQAWADGVDGRGITVANLDSGIDVTHPALRDRYRGLKADGSLDNDYSWYDVAGVCPTTDPCDADGHGTHTMGTMLGSAPEHRIGVAPGATWIGVNGCAFGTCTDEDLLSSAQWLLAPTRTDGTGADPGRRPHIINNSWGSDPGSSGNPFYDEVIDAWDAAGIFSSWSIGNSGPSCGTAAAPGGRTTGYSVGAYGHTGDLAFFSSRGPGQDGLAKPNITAPGVGVVSALPGGTYGPNDGTSMAAPHVAGSVALLWSARPELIGDVAGTERLLDRTAHDVDDTTCGGTAADNSSWGEGTLDAAALLDAAPTVFGTLTGSVADADGQPLSGAVVTASGDGERSAATGADGSFSLPLVPGSYTVRISAFGHRASTRTVVVPEGGGTASLGVTTLMTAPRHRVSGTLTQPGGFPVIETRVTLGSDVAPVTTGADGGFTFSDVPEGTYTLRVPGSVCGQPVALEVVVDGDETLAPVQRVQASTGYAGCRRVVGGFRPGTERNEFTAGAHLTRKLPFPFVWFGRPVQSIEISPKGFLRFDPGQPDPRDQPVTDNWGMPDSRLSAAVMPFFDDLQTAAVYTGTTTVDGEPAYVIEWRDASFTPVDDPGTSTPGSVDFSVTLTGGGDAIIGWGAGVGADPVRGGSSASIGFQSFPDPGQNLTTIEYGDHADVADEDRGLVLDGEPTGFVHVSVSDANDDQAITGARVTLTPETGAPTTATTDAAGEVTVQLPLGAYTVTAAAQDYTSSATTVTLGSEAEVEDVAADLATSAAKVKAARTSWLLGPRDTSTGKVTVSNTGTVPMTVSFAETRRDAAVDRATGAARAVPRSSVAVRADDAAPPAMRRTRVLSTFKTAYDSNAGVAYDGTSLWTNELYGERVARYGFDGTLRQEIVAEWDRTHGLLFVGDLAYDSTTGSLCEAIHADGRGELRCYSRTDGVERYALDGSWAAVSPGGLAYNEQDDVFYLSGNGYLFTVNGTTHPSPGRLVRSCSLATQDSRGLAYNPSTGMVWEAGVRQDHPGARAPRYNQLQEVSPLTCETVSTASVPDSIGWPGGLEIDPAGRLWMADPGASAVHFLDVDDAVTTDLPWLTVPTGTATIPAGDSRTFTVGVRGAGARAGMLAGNIVVRTSSGRASTQLVPVTVARSAYRVGVNAGGKGHRDGSGFAWSGDRRFRPGQWGFRGETKVVTTTKAIGGTTEDRLFRSARTARRKSFTYTFADAPAGRYQVELGFAEIAGARKGRRVFDVRVDGKAVLRKVDAARSGQRRAVVRSLEVNHKSGPLVITFLRPRHAGKPMVSSIRVTQRPDW